MRRRSLGYMVAISSFSSSILLGALAVPQAQPQALDLNPELTLNQRVFLDAQPAPEPPDRPLMWALDKAGLAAPMKKAGLSLTGHVEGSYTYNLKDPSNDVNNGRVFDMDHNEAILNQFDITLTRDVDVKKFDVGGVMEWIYGGDARFIHANGLFDYHNNDVSALGKPTPPDNQWDLTQLFLKVNVPIAGKPLSVVAGKMVTHMGYETINPTGNDLYSHSLLFDYAIPFTHTGVMAFYPVADGWTVMGGFSRGWDQATEDNNGALDLLGQVSWTKDKYTATFGFVAGPEQAGDNGHWRTTLDGIFIYRATDKLKFAVNADLGWEGGVPDIGNTSWYGVAFYAGYVLCDTATLNARAEWFHDSDGTRIGIKGDFYELTVGMAITPFPKNAIGSNLLIRPEARWDYCDKEFFVGGTQQNQVTLALDVIFKL